MITSLFLQNSRRILRLLMSVGLRRMFMKRY
nr:MAG TPA: hypothetical protein [Caudoviricetes sp.]